MVHFMSGYVTNNGVYVSKNLWSNLIAKNVEIDIFNHKLPSIQQRNTVAYVTWSGLSGQ